MNSTSLRLLALVTLTLVVIAIGSPLVRAAVAFDEPVTVALVFAALGLLVGATRRRRGAHDAR